MFERPAGGEKAILIHLDRGDAWLDEAVSEFKELALSAGAFIVETLVVKRHSFDPKYCLGSGKALEIKGFVAAQAVGLVIINHSLSPAQQRNLEQLWQCRVLDRIGLILDIFAKRARTHEGKLQVELAQLEYMSTRLVRGWTHLERQKGGIGLRGPGETQLETDRRLIKKRIDVIKDRLKKIRKQRIQSARARQKSAQSVVTLVGYTNTGKSTLFNQLIKAYVYTHRSDDAQQIESKQQSKPITMPQLEKGGVYAADQLFATLDPTLRRVWLGPGPEDYIILADTVGFIRDLPHQLVDAFRATLEETRQANLLLHVIDAHNPSRQDQAEEVYKVLDEIAANEVPVLEVMNKIDLLENFTPRIDRDEEGLPIRVFCSALTQEGMNLLRMAISERLAYSLQ